MDIDFLLEKEIKEYCELNGIEFVIYVNKLLRRAFMIDKYGEKPAFLRNNNEETPQEQNKEKPEEIAKEEQVIQPEMKKRGRPKKDSTITIKTFKPEKEIVIKNEEIIVKPKKRKLT